MAKHNDEIIKKVKMDYENGKSINQLSKEYGISMNTIKYWSSKNGWIKKKANQPTTNQTKKPTNRNVLKKEVYKRIMKGETLEKIEQETGVSKSTSGYWSAKYKWIVGKEIELNNKLFKIRETVIGDRGLKIQELIEWQQKQLEDVKRQIEEEFVKKKPDMSIINFKLVTIDKYLKMQFKLLGIRYTGELTDLIRVANQIKTDEEKLNLDRQKYLLEKKKAGLMLTPEEEAEIEENMDLYEKMMGDRE